MSGGVTVFGPAYLDRVLRVDGPLWGLGGRDRVDRSVNGSMDSKPSSGVIELVDDMGQRLVITLPSGWPGPTGRVMLENFQFPPSQSARIARGIEWSNDLGGMGAGYAAALGGTLVHVLGPPEDPISQRVEALLRRYEVSHHAVHVAGRVADWTLLISSGENGDKLAVGFRGCQADLNLSAFDPWLTSSDDIRVVAGLENRLAAHVLSAPGARCRLFAPSLRNMLDHDVPATSFAAAVDILCCNRLEWESLDDREEVGWRVSVLVVTDGPDGSWARFTGPQGETATIRQPAFPRARPPRDTNRAGEAFAATLVSTLLSEGWDPGPGVVEESLMRHAMQRASVAAALVLDRVEFRFATEAAIEKSIVRGQVD